MQAQDSPECQLVLAIYRSEYREAVKSKVYNVRSLNILRAVATYLAGLDREIGLNGKSSIEDTEA